MNSTITFPYPALLPLSNGIVTRKHDYYVINPHKTIRLLIKTEPREDNHGFYVFSSGDYFFKKVASLKSSKIIYNLDKEEEPWLFIDESSPSFHHDIEMLVTLIKMLRTR